MNRNLKLCLSLVIVTLLIPLTILQVNLPTLEWPMFWQVRTYLVNYSGIASMILMSLCVILSVKHWPLEKYLKGLDQQYRLHKYLGISAVFTALFHWLAFLSDDFAMDMGYVAAKDETFPFWKLIDALGDPAQLIGEYGFYLSSGFVLIAWIKKFKYKVFEFTHKLFPYIYLALVAHMLMFFEASMWLTGVGVLLAFLSTLASVGCLITILEYNGKTKRHTARIQAVKPLSNGLDITLTADDFSYQPGQFAFVGFNDQEKPHPFSIASTKQSGDVRLLIKSSGDYTRALKAKLEVRQSATIEGPYGCFNFEDNSRQQIWISAGIGIAPFLSAIEHIASKKRVTLFYTYRDIDPELLQELKSRAIDAGVRLYLRDTTIDNRFSQQEILESVLEPSRCSVWYCGPSKLGSELEKAFCEKQVNAFHRELFEFR